MYYTLTYSLDKNVQGSFTELLIIFCETGKLEEAYNYFRLAFDYNWEEWEELKIQDKIIIREGIDYDIAYKYFAKDLVDNLPTSYLRWLSCKYWDRCWSSIYYVNNKWGVTDDNRVNDEKAALEIELAEMYQQYRDNNFEDLDVEFNEQRTKLESIYNYYQFKNLQ